MKTEIIKLSAALSRLKSIVAGGRSLPILSCVRLTAENNTLTIEASDLDQYQTESIECEGEMNSCCIGLRALGMSLAGSGQITITPTKGGLNIKTSIGTFELLVLPGSDFPALPSVAKSISTGVSCADLAKAMSVVKWAASTDISRYVMQSVHVVGNPKSLRVESTNGRELAVCDNALICAKFECIVPSKAVANVCAALEREESELLVSDNHIQVKYFGGCFTANLVDGQFPNTKVFIDENSIKLGEVDRESLADVMARCNFFADPSRTPVAALEFSPIGIDVSFSGSQSSMELSVPCKMSKHSARVNAESFWRCLTAIKSDTITLSRGVDKLFIESDTLKIISMNCMVEFQGKKKKEAKPEPQELLALV